MQVKTGSVLCNISVFLVFAVGVFFFSLQIVVAQTVDCSNPSAVISAFDRARCTLNKVGDKTGYGETVSAKSDKVFIERFAGIVNVVLGLVGIIATLYVIYSGIQWMRAGGEEEIITKAKEGIKSAIIGLIIIFSAYVVVNFVVTYMIKAVTSGVGGGSGGGRTAAEQTALCEIFVYDNDANCSRKNGYPDLTIKRCEEKATDINRSSASVCRVIWDGVSL